MIHFDPPVALITVLLGFLALTPLSNLLRKRSIFGTVTDCEGHPLPAAAVQIRSVSNGTVRRDTTDDLGRFYFGRLKPSYAYEITVLHDEHGSASIELQPSPSNCDLHLELGSSRYVGRLRILREIAIDSFSPGAC